MIVVALRPVIRGEDKFVMNNTPAIKLNNFEANGCTGSLNMVISRLMHFERSLRDVLKNFPND